METPQRNAILVDVRSPAEFATGKLSNDLYSAVNIEYTIIDQLPLIYSALGTDVSRDDDITLYCRSGRRSNIALQTLKGMGFTTVRDIGGFEEATKVLQNEKLERELGVGKDGPVVVEEKAQERKHARARSFGTLLDGLKGLE